MDFIHFLSVSGCEFVIWINQIVLNKEHKTIVKDLSKENALVTAM